MASYTGTVSTLHPQEDVWRYLADLRSITEWDPSVSEARLIEGEPGEVGARYELDVGFLGRTVSLGYETTISEPPHRIVFTAETGTMAIVDEALVRRIPDGNVVTWNASLRLKGIRRLLELPLQVAFGRLGRNAEEGLRRRLAGPSLSAAVEERATPAIEEAAR